jgi:hypothetical protein
MNNNKRNMDKVMEQRDPRFDYEPVVKDYNKIGKGVIEKKVERYASYISQRRR